MFIFGSVLFELLFRTIESLLPIIIIALIISLIMRNTRGRKTEYGYVKPGEVLMDDAQPRAPNNSSAMNVLLYLGSFLIVGSMFLIVRDEPSLMPAILIIVTLLTYIAGIILYRFVDFLRPVATAFTYTAIVLFPAWFYAFKEIGTTEEIAMLISTAFSMIAYVIAAVAIESRIAGWLSYIWILLFGWSFAATLDSAIGGSTIITYAFFLWPCIIAILPNIFWSCRVKWLPVPYRHATKAIAEWLTPIFVIFLLPTLFSPQIANNYPMLRTATISVAILNTVISLLITKKRSALIALRLYIQALIVFIVADATRYSIIPSHNTVDAGASLAMAIVWLVSFLFQAIFSLFAPQRNEDDKRFERGVLIASLVGVFMTTLFCLGFDHTPRAISLIAVTSSVAALGILISARYCNLTWLIATVIAINFIPIELSELSDIHLGHWIYFLIYAAISIVMLFIYGIFALVKAQPKESLRFVFSAIITGGAACISASALESHSEAGWGLIAVETAVVALISKQYALFEVASYIGCWALSALIGNGQRKAYYISDSSDLALDAVRANIISLPILAFGFAKERKGTQIARTIIGYILLSAAMFIISSSASYNNNYLIPVIFIFEEVALLLAGVFLKHKWMTIASTVFVVLTTLELTGGPSSIWLLIIGVALIVIVTLQLVKNSKK